MTAVMSGKPGVKHLLQRMVHWRVGIAWYLFILVAVAAIYVLSIALLPGAMSSFKAPTLTMGLLYPLGAVITGKSTETGFHARF